MKRLLSMKQLLPLTLIVSFLLGLVLWSAGRGVSANTTVAAQATSGFKASTAQIDITPTNNGFPRMFLAGFGDRSTDSPGLGTFPGEPGLSARAIALDDGSCPGNIKVIVTADILGFTRQLRQQILMEVASRYQLPAANLLLSATHTHNGPVLKDNLDPAVAYPGFSTDGIAGSADLVIVDNYTNWLKQSIVNLIGTAINGLPNAPAVTLSYGGGVADIGRNRVGVGNEDNDLPVLAVRSVSNNSLVAVLFGAACHPVVAGIAADYKYYFHPDFPGLARAQVEANNPGAMAFFIQGAAGDINPDPDIMITQANLLANGVQEVLSVNLLAISGSILTEVRDVTLPLNLDPNDPAHAQMRATYVSIRDTSGDSARTRHANQMIARIDAGTLPVTENWPVSVRHFGSSNNAMVLAALGGEVVSEYALNLKAQFRSQLGNTLWVAAYSNEVPGYISSNQIWDLTGYEAGWAAGNPFVSSYETSQMYYGWAAPLKRGDSMTPGLQEIVMANTTAMISNPPTGSGDTTPPVITLNGANPMTVQCPAGFTDPGATALDGCSGARPVTVSGSVNVAIPGSYTITYKAGDATGNMATKTRTVNVVDTTAPIIQCPANVVVTLPLNSTATSINVTYPAPTATDACGSATVSTNKASGSLFSLGMTTVTATANDGRGNTSQCSFTVTVLNNFIGFFQPVDNAPVVNAVTAGQSVPVKFSLSGNKGLNIFVAGYPLSQINTCSSGIPDDIEETVTAGASSLSYDATTDRYNYIWKTDKAWKGTCRKLVLKFNDGSTHEALFWFK